MGCDREAQETRNKQMISLGGLGVISAGEQRELCSLQSSVLRKGCIAITSQVIAQPQGMFSGLAKDSQHNIQECSVRI